MYPILEQTAWKPYPSQRHIPISLIYGSTPLPLLGGFWPSDDEHFRQHQRWQPESKVTNWTSARKDAVTMSLTRTLARYLNFSYREGVVRLKYLSNNNNKRCNVKFQLQCQQWAIRSSALFHIRALWRVARMTFRESNFWISLCI